MSTTGKAARQLKALRQKYGISIRDAAYALGKSASSYQHYEDRYKKDWLPIDTVEDIRQAWAKWGVKDQDMATLDPRQAQAPKEIGPILMAPDPKAAGLAEASNFEGAPKKREEGNDIRMQLKDGRVVVQATLDAEGLEDLERMLKAWKQMLN